MSKSRMVDPERFPATTRPTILALAVGICWVLWLAVVAFAPAEVYWRDAPEFVLAATFLDTAHPAGFPLYSQVANIVAALPLGGAAWRVNLFSSLCAIAAFVVIGGIVYRFGRISYRLSRSVALLIAVIPALIVLQSPVMLRQASTAEVYCLHGLLLALLLSEYQRFRFTADLRTVPRMAFLLGLSAGNHAAVAVIAVVMAPLLVLEWRRIRAVIAPSLMVFAVGLAVYGFLPLRAQIDLPLNSAAVTSTGRFVEFLTNSRDRELRRSVSDTVLSESAPANRATQTLRNLGLDLLRVSREVGWVWSLVAPIGLALLWRLDRRFALGTVAVTVATLGFFSRWDPDPWVPVFLVLGLWVGVVVAWCSTLVSHTGGSVIGVTSVMVAAAGWWWSDNSGVVAGLSSQRLTVDATRQHLQALPEKSVYLVEGSWFLARYAQLLEGIREDVTLLYQPALLFPRYFPPAALSASQSSYITTGEASQLSVVVDFVTRHGAALCFEPSAALNKRFSEIAQVRENGVSCLERGQSGRIDPRAVGHLTREATGYRELALAEHSVVRTDALEYGEGRFVGVAGLLAQADDEVGAQQVLDAFCGQLQGACSAVARNNLALRLAATGRADEALRVLDGAIERFPGAAEVLRRNRALVEGVRRP